LCRQYCKLPTDCGKSMLSLQALLNPASPGHSVTHFQQSESVSVTTSTLPPAEVQTSKDVSPVSKVEPLASTLSMTKSKPLGPINFPPFEEIDPASHLEMCRFQVNPFGKIRQSCQHSPYNSSKKDFFEKTGRESIEGKGDPLPQKQKIDYLEQDETKHDGSFQIRISITRQGKDLYSHVGL
jgi:hypothetical protein